MINVKAVSLLPVKLMVKARVTVQEHVESQNRERERGFRETCALVTSFSTILGAFPFKFCQTKT